MTNADKYLKNETDIFDIAKGITERICSWDDFEYSKDLVFKEVKVFFTDTFKDEKPTLTQDERIILENLNTEEWKAIYRTIHGDLELHTRVCDADETCGWTAFYEFNHLFKFIENNEQYSIKELLE